MIILHLSLLYQLRLATGAEIALYFKVKHRFVSFSFFPGAVSAQYDEYGLEQRCSQSKRMHRATWPLKEMFIACHLEFHLMCLNVSESNIYSVSLRLSVCPPVRPLAWDNPAPKGKTALVVFCFCVCVCVRVRMVPYFRLSTLETKCLENDICIAVGRP